MAEEEEGGAVAPEVRVGADEGVIEEGRGGGGGGEKEVSILETEAAGVGGAELGAEEAVSGEAEGEEAGVGSAEGQEVTGGGAAVEEGRVEGHVLRDSHPPLPGWGLVTLEGKSKQKPCSKPIRLEGLLWGGGGWVVVVRIWAHKKKKKKKIARNPTKNKYNLSSRL